MWLWPRSFSISIFSIIIRWLTLGIDKTDSDHFFFNQDTYTTMSQLISHPKEFIMTIFPIIFQADSSFQWVSCTQHTSTLRRDNMFAIAVDCPLIVTTLRVTINGIAYSHFWFLVYSVGLSPWYGFWVFRILSLFWYNINLWVFEIVFTARCSSCCQPTIRSWKWKPFSKISPLTASRWVSLMGNQKFINVATLGNHFNSFV